MSKPLKPRRGTTAEHAAFIGQAHEVTYDTDKQTLVCHDGLTAGGFPLARADEVAQKNSQQDAAISSKVASVNGLTPDSDGNVDVGGMPLGTVFPYTGKDVPAGTLRADGSTYTNMRASFPDFYAWVVASGLTVALGSYALVDGSCGFYGVDESTGTVRMPTLAAGVFGASVAGQYGMAVEAGLPNLTGSFDTGDRRTYINKATGVFYKSVAASNKWAQISSDTGNTQGVGFDASRANPIYGKSDTVTPSHVKYPWVIVVYNAAVSASVAQAGEFVELLDGKVDKFNPKDSDGKNLVRLVNGVAADAAGNVQLGKGVYITETWSANDKRDWYRKWSDGFIEQAGWVSGGSGGDITVSLQTPFTTNLYHVSKTNTDSSGDTYNAHHASVWGRTTSSFKIRRRSDDVFWYACGY